MRQRYPSFVREEIENWIAWCWAGESPEPREPSRCRSVEGNFTAPPWGEDHEEPTAANRIFNRENAERVEKIFKAQPQIARRVLMYEYTKRSHYDTWEQGQEMQDGWLTKAWVRTGNTKRETACRELRISRAEYERHVDEFKVQVFGEFRR